VAVALEVAVVLLLLFVCLFKRRKKKRRSIMTRARWMGQSVSSRIESNPKMRQE